MHLETDIHGVRGGDGSPREERTCERCGCDAPPTADGFMLKARGTEGGSTDVVPSKRICLGENRLTQVLTYRHHLDGVGIPPPPPWSAIKNWGGPRGA
ncbi:hypothetical protein ACP4OV_014312 [Aristida adscensionis]